MIVKKFALGSLNTNCYLIINGTDCLIVDPACDVEFIKSEIGALNLCGVLVTHYHFDHIGALNELVDYYKKPIYDYNSLGNIKNNSFSFKVISNPGHTEDSVSFFFEKDNIMFVGDFIFKNSIGRTDLETGSMEHMQQSLGNIKKYNDSITLYPGHGDITNLGIEKNNNVFFS